MSQNGKGDSPRKKGVSERVWARNWERIFGTKDRKVAGTKSGKGR